jgi:hypothetical protein
MDDVAPSFGRACQIHWFECNTSSTVGQSTNDTSVTGTVDIRKNWPSVVAHPEGFTPTSLPNVKNHQRIDLLYMDCGGCEWSLFHSILQYEPLQLVVQTHDLPLPDRPKPTKEFGVLPALAMSDVVNAFCRQGYALYAKRVHSATEECLTTDWSFLRLRLEGRQCL